MTFDPVFGDFNGPVHVDSSNPTLLTTAGGVGSVGTAMLGGMVSILQGAGAGQIRRLTGVENSSRFVIDKPFTTTPDSTSVVQVGPCKIQPPFTLPYPLLAGQQPSARYAGGSGC